MSTDERFRRAVSNWSDSDSNSSSDDSDASDDSEGLEDYVDRSNRELREKQTLAASRRVLKHPLLNHPVDDAYADMYHNVPRADVEIVLRRQRCGP